MDVKFFPYDTVRKEQDKLIQAVQENLEGGQLVVHAPTGLGKTAGVLAPAVEYALDHDKLVLFLTSRLTQHALALQTVQQISERHDVRIPVVDLIGKQHMCLQKNVQQLTGKEFSEYCKNVREDNLCEYYERLKTGEEASGATKRVLVQLGTGATPEVVKEHCSRERLCPYEVTMLLARKARVIVADYSYVFNPRIREGFFHRIGATLRDCILIVDEGHNLPERVKDLATERITRNTISRAIRELEKVNEDHVHHVRQLGEFIVSLCTREERYVTRQEFLEELAEICSTEDLITDLQRVAVAIREEQKASSAGALADFLEAWRGPDEGYARILKREDDYWQLSYRCLDPSAVTEEVFDDAHSSVIMSGTLTPVEMYGELLGLGRATHVTLPSPFPTKNRLNIIIPKTTTKFTARGPEMYAQIAKLCGDLIAMIPGNVAVFFPSYALMQEVHALLDTRTEKTVLVEHRNLTKQEREELLATFRERKLTGAVLLGVMGGSFSEGIDLPGSELHGVIIVGLPLGKPDLETKALIDYYQEKFGKGWEYGYTFPALNRTMQSAGRCIRSETDKGVIVFLDERYAWQQYYGCFPKDWNVRVSLLYERMIREFFSKT